MKERSVLVTGGAGYIGSHAILALLEGGWRPVVVDDLSTGHRELVAKGVPLTVGNVADGALVHRVLHEHRCKAVIHFAGSVIVPESVEKPLEYYANNTCASRSLVAACVEAGVEVFVFSSTAAVYDTPNDARPVDEGAPTRPNSPYGASKLMTEWMLRDVAQATGLRYAALRYFNVAGADASMRCGQMAPNPTHLIRVAAQAALGIRDHVDIFGTDYETADGTGVRDYIHVADLAEAHVRVLDRLTAGAASMVLNCGYGRGFSVREVLDVMRNVSGSAFGVRSAARRPGDAAVLVADSRRIREKLDWNPRRDDLTLIVKSALEWEKRLRR